MLNIRQIAVNMFRENTYLLWNGGPSCAIVDPGCQSDDEFRALTELIGQNGLTPAAILVTHGHHDHIFGVKKLLGHYGDMPVYMTATDRDLLVSGGFFVDFLCRDKVDTDFPVTEVSDAGKVTVADMEFEVIATPGHSPGSVCWLDRSHSVMFTGDTLFAGTIGRTDLPHCEYDDEIRSIMEKLLPLDPGTRIFPGHGPGSTIGRERCGNPFLEPFNEPEEEIPEDLAPVSIKGF